MEYSGKVQGNTVILDGTPNLPDGTPVRVVVLLDTDGPRNGSPCLSEVLLSFAGQVHGLPDDMSENHDHYLYGVPKR